MRVGLVCPYSFDVPGGVQHHVRDLATALIARGHDVHVLAPGRTATAGPVEVITVGRAVPLSYNGSVARVAFGPRVAAQVHRWLRAGEFDVVHVHEPTSPSVSVLALWSATVPVVATFHTANPRSRSMSGAGVLLRPALEKVAARIAVSEVARDTLVQHVGGEPVVIPNGLFCDRFQRAEPRPEWTRGGPTVAFLGRFDEPRKGLPVAVEALRILLEKHPRTRLLVAGQGREDPTPGLPQGLRRRIQLLGGIDDAAAARLLASASVYLAPQLGGESFGIVLAEAMAAGAPVVASDLPAFRAMLGGGRFGQLFRPGDAADAARALSRVLTDPACGEELARAACIEVGRYDWSRLVPQIEAVYETVTSPRGAIAAA